MLWRECVQERESCLAIAFQRQGTPAADAASVTAKRDTKNPAAMLRRRKDERTIACVSLKGVNLVFLCPSVPPSEHATNCIVTRPCFLLRWKRGLFLSKVPTCFRREHRRAVNMLDDLDVGWLSECIRKDATLTKTGPLESCPSRLRQQTASAHPGGNQISPGTGSSRRGSPGRWR